MSLPDRLSQLVRHGLLGTTLVGAASTGAAASPCDDVAERSVGLVLGFDFTPKPRLIGGIEGRHCTSDKAEVFVRLEFGGGTRLIGGARIRPFETDDGEQSNSEHVGLEVGLALDFKARFGAHLAATYGTHYAYLAAQGLFHLTGEPQPTRGSLVGGFSPWTMKEQTVVEGRPIIRDGRMLRPAFASQLPHVRSAEERAVRDHFASSAQLELSSVWTFWRLAAELVAVGAPPALVARALAAADDEIRHAAACARAAGGIELLPLPMSVAMPRFVARSPHALAVLAAEAWCEGCLNETAAAEEARYAAADAHGPNAAMLATIARDEAGHAELAWAVLTWVLETAPDVAMIALADVPAAAISDHGPTDRALARHGVPTAQLTAAARGHAEASARSRLHAMI